MFDFDQGWQGVGQFWFGYQYDSEGDRGGEWDGDDASENPVNVTAAGTPYTTGRVANMTVIGYKGSTAGAGILFRNNCAMSMYNSLVVSSRNGVTLNNGTASATAIKNTFDHLTDGTIVIRGNVFADIVRDSAVGGISNIVATKDTANVWRINSTNAANTTAWRSNLRNANNVIFFASNILSYPATGRVSLAAANVNPVPASTTGFPTVTTPTGTAFTAATFVGAFNPSVTFANSWANWTFFYKNYGL
jgi:hypothetical protein